MKTRKRKRFNYLNETAKFSAIGIVIPGFTAIAVMGFQMGISSLGIECSQAWIYTWTVTFIGGIVSPLLFVRFIKRTALNNESIGKRLLAFNILEYTFLQASIASFMTSGNTLCYVGDGQNGLEFAFAGWMGIPILVLLSFIFNQIRKATDSQNGLIAET